MSPFCSNSQYAHSPGGVTSHNPPKQGLEPIHWSQNTCTLDLDAGDSSLGSATEQSRSVQVKQVRGYMKDDNFTLDNIRAVSSAGAGLLKWVFAMVNYYDVARGVEPKRKKVADSERSLRMAERDLTTMQVGHNVLDWLLCRPLRDSPSYSLETVVSPLLKEI